MTALERQLDEVIRPIVESLGYRMVRLLLMGQRLQLMAEHQDYRPIGLEDCRIISHSVSAVLDADDIIHGSYNLEVSSCGIKRPLTSLEDVSFFVGRQASFTVETQTGQFARIMGVILSVDAIAKSVKVTLCDDEQNCYDVDWHRVKKAHLKEETTSKQQRQKKR